ncbi:MAG: nucleotide excision repair endonuclease [Vicinamibacterales bacterium]
MLLRDKLLAELAAMGAQPDYARLAADVLGIRNAPPALARRLVEQALVVEDRREVWLRTGERICADAPDAPGVYLLRDAQDSVLYVGKANNIRRRLRTHFAARRWHMLKPEFARAARAEWMIVGSEIEALLREAIWIREYAPKANVQVGTPSLDARAVPATLLRDTLVLVPSVDQGAVELLAVRVAGPVLLVRIQRDGTGLPARIKTVRQFFAASDDDAERAEGCAGRFAPLVFTWLNGRGAAATRLDPHDAGSARELQRRVKLLVDDERLFTERIVVLRSEFRSTLARALSSVG